MNYRAKYLALVEHVRDWTDNSASDVLDLRAHVNGLIKELGGEETIANGIAWPDDPKPEPEPELADLSYRLGVTVGGLCVIAFSCNEAAAKSAERTLEMAAEGRPKDGG